MKLFREQRIGLALASVFLMAGFFVNMMFVVSARTALLYMAVMLLLFGAVYLGRTARILLFSAAITTAAVVLVTSPYLRHHLELIAVDYQNYQRNIAGSTGLRPRRQQTETGDRARRSGAHESLR